ncbi:hypothetical protein ACFX1R_008017 [Malus domestica]
MVTFIRKHRKLKETFILKIKPQRLLEDPLKSTFKDQAHGHLKKLPTVHPRSSLDGPSTNETPINQHLTEIESEDQIRERLNFPCSQIGTPGGISLHLISSSVQGI